MLLFGKKVAYLLTDELVYASHCPAAPGCALGYCNYLMFGILVFDVAIDSDHYIIVASLAVCVVSNSLSQGC